MERTEIETKLKPIFNALFDIPVSSINAETSPDNVDKWDSMQQLNLVTSIEDEFGVQLEAEQVIEMQNFGLIVEVLFEVVSRTKH